MMYALLASNGKEAILLDFYADEEDLEELENNEIYTSWHHQFEEVGSNKIDDLGFPIPSTPGIYFWKGKVEYKDPFESLADEDPEWIGNFKFANFEQIQSFYLKNKEWAYSSSK